MVDFYGTLVGQYTNRHHDPILQKDTPEVQGQIKWLVFRMIHGFRIPGPTNGQNLVDLDFLGIFFLGCKNTDTNPSSKTADTRPGEHDATTEGSHFGLGICCTRKGFSKFPFFWVWLVLVGVCCFSVFL